MSYLVLVLVSGDRDWLYSVESNSRFSPEDGERIQSSKCCVLNKNRTMDNVQKHNNQIFFCCMQHYVASTNKILLVISLAFQTLSKKLVITSVVCKIL
jgi:hypothetical protein